MATPKHTGNRESARRRTPSHTRAGTRTPAHTRTKRGHDIDLAAKRIKTPKTLPSDIIVLQSLEDFPHFYDREMFPCPTAKQWQTITCEVIQALGWKRRADFPVSSGDAIEIKFFNPDQTKHLTLRDLVRIASISRLAVAHRKGEPLDGVAYNTTRDWLLEMIFPANPDFLVKKSPTTTPSLVAFRELVTEPFWYRAHNLPGIPVILNLLNELKEQTEISHAGQLPRSTEYKAVKLESEDKAISLSWLRIIRYTSLVRFLEDQLGNEQSAEVELLAISAIMNITQYRISQTEKWIAHHLLCNKPQESKNYQTLQLQLTGKGTAIVRKKN